MSTFAQIFERNKYQLPQIAKKSRGWFEQEAQKIKSQGRVSAYYLMRGAAEQNRPAIVPGNLYMFLYDAKHKETLPYWDAFPMVFPFRKLKDGFIGLNLHYAPIHLRIRLLDNLMDYSTNKSYNESTRLKLNWSLISGASKLRIAQPCVHRYLISHVKSPFKMINSEDWATAMMLPVQQFVGAASKTVWDHSIKSM